MPSESDKNVSVMRGLADSAILSVLGRGASLIILPVAGWLLLRAEADHDAINQMQLSQRYVEERITDALKDRYTVNDANRDNATMQALFQATNGRVTSLEGRVDRMDSRK